MEKYYHAGLEDIVMNKQKQVYTIGIVFMMICIVFAGCSENNSAPKNGNNAALSYVDVEILSAIDSKTVEDACVSYIAMRLNQSKNASLSALLNKLTSNSDVKAAELLDNNTIWIEFQDGKVTTISERTSETYDTTDEEYDYFALKNNIVTGSYISDNQQEHETTSTNVMAAPSVLPPLGAPVTGDKEHSPASKKILFMSAATESFKNQDVDLFNLISGYLIYDHGWDADGITLKYNAESDNYQSLYFDDFFDLENYGVSVVLAHGFYNRRPIDIHDLSSPEEDFLYTQVRAGGTPTRLIGSYVIDTAEEYIKERIIYGVEVDPFKDTTTGYFYMRHDLWFEQIGNLPNSLVFLLHCQRQTGDFMFPPKNIGNYVSWDNPVSPTIALDSIWLIPYMAVADRSASQILQDLIKPKTRYATGTLVLYPEENDYLYLPTWIDISLTSIPPDCEQVTIDISYEDTTVTPPGTNTLTESKDISPHTFIGLIPGKRLKIGATALDSTGNVIRLKETTVNLTTGENTLEMDFGSFKGVTLTAEKTILDYSPNRATPDSSVVTASVTDESGNPAKDCDVYFTAPWATIKESNPVKTNTEGKAHITVEVEPWMSLPNPTTLTLREDKLLTCSLDGATTAAQLHITTDVSDYVTMRLSGSPNQTFAWGDPNTTFEAAGISIQLAINNPDSWRTVWKYSTAIAYSEHHYYAFNFSSKPQLGSTLYLYFEYYNVPTGYIRQTYLHMFNSWVHYVKEIPAFTGTASDPKGSFNTVIP